MSTSPFRDLTHRQRTVHVGHTPLFKWLCGHQAKRAGGFVRAGILMRCGTCQVVRATNRI